MASPIFRLSTGPAAIGPWTTHAWDTAIDAAAGEFVRVDLQSSAGVKAIAVTIPSADEVTLAEAAIAVTVSQALLIGIFQLPNTAGIDNSFRSLNVQVTINSGLTNNVADATLTRSLQVCVPNGAGLRAFVAGEEFESSRTFGWTPKANALAHGTGSPNTKVYEDTCTTTPGAGQTQTVVTIPKPHASCVVQFAIKINGVATGLEVSTTDARATAKYNSAGGAWTLDPVGILELAGYAEDAAWSYAWGIVGQTIEFTCTGDAAETTVFQARVDAYYQYT